MPRHPAPIRFAYFECGRFSAHDQHSCNASGRRPGQSSVLGGAPGRGRYLRHFRHQPDRDLPQRRAHPRQPSIRHPTPPGEVIDSARWRVPSASNFGEPPGQSQSTTGFVSVDRSQRRQGTGDSSLIGGRRRAAIGAERLRTDVQRAKPRVSQFDSQSLGDHRGFHWSQQPSRSTMRADVSGRQTPLLVWRGAAIRAILDPTGEPLAGAKDPICLVESMRTS